MKFNNAILSLFCGMLGALMMTPIVRNVDAAPSDILGSPNVAVDVYRASGKTFVLYSDGTINSPSDSSRIDYGHPYREVPASVQLPTPESPPRYSRGKPLGSPNVAVEAVRSSDGTFVMFADGTFRRPGRDEAATASANNRTIIFGRVGRYNGVFQQFVDGPARLETIPGINPINETQVTFDTPFEEPPVIVVTPFGGEANPGGTTTTAGAKPGVIWQGGSSSTSHETRGYTFLIVGTD